MDALTFIVEMTKALTAPAWPAAVVIIGMLFRGHVGGILNGMKLRRIEKGEFRAEFESVALAVREDLPKHGSSDATPSLSPPLRKRIDQLIEPSPRDAIAESWKGLEGMVIAAAGEAGTKEGGMAESLDILVKKGLVQRETRDSLLGLQKLRNLALHGAFDKITAKEAREYVVMAEAAMWSLEANLKKSRGKS